MGTTSAAFSMLFVLMVSINANAHTRILSQFNYPSTSESGLSLDFYQASCPQVAEVVKKWIDTSVAEDPGQAAGIVRILFHDCFVQGCDASILLENPQTEQTSVPNINSLRPESIQLLDSLKEDIEVACPMTVSCADTIALAAREAIYLVGGPWIPVALGRRDGPEAASNLTVLGNIPAPTFNFSDLVFNFSSKGLDITDLVALSGAHTIGHAHCKSVDFQITPAASAELDPEYASTLGSICLPLDPNQLNVVQMDTETPNTFDNNYFKLVLAGRVPFHTDAQLLEDEQATELVTTFAKNEELFFQQFAVSLVKLSEVGVLTGDAGDVRRVCSLPNYY